LKNLPGFKARCGDRGQTPRFGSSRYDLERQRFLRTRIGDRQQPVPGEKPGQVRGRVAGCGMVF
jgi:hypothetical protein